MNTQKLNTTSCYHAPAIEIQEVSIERGFAASPVQVENMLYPGDDPTLEDYGNF